MKETGKSGLIIFRRIFAVMFIMAGLMTIIGTSEEETSIPDSRERGNYFITVTEYVSSGGTVTHRNTVKKDTGQILKKENDEYYDASKNLIEESEDSDGDGNLDWDYTYTYINNLERTAVYNKIKEGKLEAAQFDYDLNGNLVTREADSSYDGVTFNADQRYTYEYEQIAGKWKMKTAKRDDNADYTIDYTSVYTNNADGNLVTVEGYFGDMKEFDTASNYTYIYIDMVGKWYTKTVSFEVVKGLKMTYAYEYDENGNRLSLKGFVGDVAEGMVMSATYSTYDAGNKLTIEKIDDDGDGQFESVVYYDYYGDGKLKNKKTDYDNDGNGEFDLIYTYTYNTIPE